ncbi:hypothetical protein [Burkholderia multivorans]|uniref:hypothetical protein n=1 Tax=Burkholderia multivorans TaxID=87883 RepID=UPI001591B65B|nr:hypothetical protein [Burkholderia multivorans]
MLKQTEIIQQLKGGAPSPIAYDNSLYYRARLTGTGDVWRSRQGDMFRPPEFYMTPEFLSRCAGVPVIMNHPEGSATINPHDVRIVGTIIYAYLNPDDPTEVLCILRIIDGLIQEDLLTNILSTSPSIIVAGSTVSDGVIIEGAPLAAPDHLAICAQGVWDHGGPPSGIDQTIIPATDAESLTEKLEENSKIDDSVPVDPADTPRTSQFNECNAESTGPAIDWLAAIQTTPPMMFDLALIK